MSGSAECRNHQPRGKRAQRQLLIGPATRSPQRERKTRAFLLTKTYIDAGDTPTTRNLGPAPIVDERLGDYALIEILQLDSSG
jgi:hypothetical protein